MILFIYHVRCSLNFIVDAFIVPCDAKNSFFYFILQLSPCLCMQSVLYWWCWRISWELIARATCWLFLLHFFFLCVCRHCRWLMSFSISSSLYVVVTRREDGEDGLKWDLWEINVQKFAKLESFWSFWFYIKAQLFNWNLKLNLKLLSKFFLKLEHFWELFSLFLY